MKYRKKPVVIEATQWLKNGDHPKDYSKTRDGLKNGELHQFTPEERKFYRWEGDIVRYYREPGVKLRDVNLSFFMKLARKGVVSLQIVK